MSWLDLLVLSSGPIAIASGISAATYVKAYLDELDYLEKLSAWAREVRAERAKNAALAIRAKNAAMAIALDAAIEANQAEILRSLEAARREARHQLVTAKMTGVSN